VQEFEQRLQSYHELEMPVHCVANGSLGLQIGLKALGVRGEVITTPFSYVATTACPLWEGCSVKFADIEPDTLTIDPQAVEAAISSKTEAILATHVFGNPCDVEALEAIAEKHKLALIFDAAHAFGIRYKGKSILGYGDASMVSLHATKLMHAVEGGFIVAKDPAVSERMEWMRRFGHDGPESYHGVGMNAKLSEFHAAMGLCGMSHLEDILSSRQEVVQAYDRLLFGHGSDEDDFMYSTIEYRECASKNFAYYPVIFGDKEYMLHVMNRLQQQQIYPRRYFYPVLNEVECFRAEGAFPVAESVASSILCLPLSTQLQSADIDLIVNLIRG